MSLILPAMARRLYPQSILKQRIVKFVAALLGVLVITVTAWTHIPLQPIPISLQGISTFMIGALLGANWGTMSIILYLIAGAVGLPVYVGGTSGLEHLFAETGGFLFGFMVVAYMAGWFADRGWAEHRGRRVVMILAPAAAMFAFGIAWLALYTGNVSYTLKSIMNGPFMAGSVFQTVLIFALLEVVQLTARKETAKSGYTFK